jgi:hypothetical protein
MALGSTQTLKEISTRTSSWGKGGRCVGLTDFLVPIVWKCGRLNIREHQRPVQACIGIAVPISKYIYISYIFDNEIKMDLRLK